MMHLFDEWRLLPQRIALHEPSATGVVADAHLSYSAARQRLGDAIPWRTVAEEMQPLVDAAEQFELRAVIVAGDLFERGCDADILQQFLDVLKQSGIEFRGLVPGNHDRGFEQAAIPVFADGYDLAGWRIVHGDRPIEDLRFVMGHWHPAVRLNGRKVPCFLTRGECLILPAFSLDAAGVDVQREPRWRDWECYAIDGDEVIRADVH